MNDSSVVVHRSSSIARRAVQSTAFVLAGSYLNMGVGFAYTLLLTRLLRPEDFGLFALAFFFFTLLDLRGQLGLDYGFIHLQPTTPELVISHLGLQVGLSLLTFALALVAAPVLPLIGYAGAVAPVLAILAAIGVAEGAGATARSLLEKELRFSQSTAIVSGALIASYAAALYLAWRGAGVWALAAQMGVNAALGSLGFWWAARRSGLAPGRREPARDARRRAVRAASAALLRYGLGVFGASLAYAILLQFDNFLVGTLVGLAALGFYERAYKITQWPTGLVTHVVSRAALPTYAKLQADPERLRRAFGLTLWLIAALSLPIALTFFAAAPEMVRLMWGERWLPVASLIRYLLGYAALRPFLDDAGALFNAIGKPHLRRRAVAAHALGLAALATPLTVAFQARGTAVGVGLAFAVGLLVTYRLVAREIGLRPASVLRPAFVSLAVGLALYLLAESRALFGGLAPLPALIAKFLFCGVAFGLTLLAQERRGLVERAGYLWALLRGRPAAEPGAP